MTEQEITRFYDDFKSSQLANDWPAAKALFDQLLGYIQGGRKIILNASKDNRFDIFIMLLKKDIATRVRNAYDKYKDRYQTDRIEFLFDDGMYRLISEPASVTYLAKPISLLPVPAPLIIKLTKEQCEKVNAVLETDGVLSAIFPKVQESLS